MQKIGLVLNDSAGSTKGEDHRSQISTWLENRAIKADILPADKDPEAATRQLLNNGCTIIAAGGGDGTVHTVASALVHQSVTLAILPLGTLNHFAKDLGIPPDLEGSLNLLTHGKVREVDVGELNGNFFLNNSSLGLYPDQLRIRERWQPVLGKWAAAAVASAAVLARYPNLRMKIEVNEKTMNRRCAMVMIGNNEYALDRGNLTGRKSLSNHQLSIYVLRDGGRRSLFGLAARTLFSSPENAEDFESYIAQEAVIQLGKRVVPVGLDGEIGYFSTPLKYRILPSALRVLVPEDAA